MFLKCWYDIVPYSFDTIGILPYETILKLYVYIYTCMTWYNIVSYYHDTILYQTRQYDTVDTVM